MKNVEPVYEHWKSERVASSHGPEIGYRVFFGTVNWEGKAETLRKAVVLFMQYGNSEEWADAVKNNEIAFHLPPHLILEDVPLVRLAIDRVSGKP